MLNLYSLSRKIEKAKFHFALSQYQKTEFAKTPDFIQLEPTTACNLHCATCSRGIAVSEKKHVTLKDVDTILSLFPGLKSVRLQGLGEPLLHPQIDAVLQKFKERNVKIWFNSNGTLLTNEKYRNIVVDYLSDISISFDSVERTNFNRIRRGADMDDIVHGITKLVEDRDRSNPRLAIGINFVATNHNYTEIEKLYKTVLELKLDYVSIVEAENWTIQGERGYETSSSFIAESRKYAKQIARSVKDLRLKLLKKGVILGYKSHAKRMGNCFWPFKSMFITAEGLVTPCCIRMHKNHAFGNIFDAHTIDDIWNGQLYRDFRKSHIMNKDPKNTICANCPD